MSKHQEALDELEANAVQWMANHKWKNGDGFVDDDGIEKMINNSKLLQQLIDERVYIEKGLDSLLSNSQESDGYLGCVVLKKDGSSQVVGYLIPSESLIEQLIEMGKNNE